jgi:transglutaminase-like putative cysteine protease
MSFRNYNQDARPFGQRSYKIYREEIGTGDSAIYKTVNWMKRIINHDSREPVVIDFTYQITAGVFTPFDKIQAVFEWAKNNIKYIKDGTLSQIIKSNAIMYGNFFNNPAGVEVLTSPKFLIEEYLRGKQPTEDCDGYTMLILTMLKVLGIKGKMKIISIRPNLTYSHVYPFGFDGSQWLALDAIRKEFQIGQEPKIITRSFEVMI